MYVFCFVRTSTAMERYKIFKYRHYLPAFEGTRGEAGGGENKIHVATLRELARGGAEEVDDRLSRTAAAVFQCEQVLFLVCSFC